MAHAGPTRSRKPTALKIIKGTLNASRVNHAEPQGLPAIPAAPEHLDTEERAAWERFAGRLAPMRVTTEDDFAALESLATAWVQAQRLRAQLRKDAAAGDTSLTYESVTEKGGVIQRIKAPLTALNEVDRRVEKWLGKFGLTPADRSRVMAGDFGEKTQPEDEFA